MPVDTDRTTVFRRLHEAGCFVIPNPWDVGSARTLERLGFKALATTSSGFAWTLGRSDNAVSLEEALDHIRAIAGSVEVPVNADFEGGFAVEPEGVAANVGRAVSTGIAGISIEDSTGDPDDPLFDPDLAVERIRAARAAIDASGTGVLLTGRSEGFIVGRPDLAETIRRLVAYADAGADCLYAPGLRAASDISAVVAAVSPKPVNVLVGSHDDSRGAGRARRPADQPRRRPGSHRMGRLPAGSDGARRARDVRRLRRCGPVRGARRLLPRSLISGHAKTGPSAIDGPVAWRERAESRRSRGVSPGPR